jgi:PBP1b-binding outer membrane lipoprotein LpoB
MKTPKTSFSIITLAILLSGCATILGGKTTTYQKTKPTNGQPQRQVRIGYLIADAVLSGPVGLAVDFVTGAIYKPVANSK